MCEEEAAKGGTQHRGTDHSGVDFHSIAPSTRPMTKALPSVAMSVAVEFRTGFARLALSGGRSEEHTSELQSLMRISYAVFCLKKKKKKNNKYTRSEVNLN